VPSRVEMVQAVREASDDANAAGSRVLARYYEDHPELASGDPAQAMNDFALVRVAVNDEVAKRVRPVIDRFDAQVRHQQVAIDRLKFLSPAILLQDALNDISGTGAARHRFFLAQVDRFHQQWRALFTPLIFQKASFTTFENVPRFAFQEEPTSAVVSRVIWSLLGLALPAVLLVVIGLRRLHRFPIVSNG
jgi:ABC-2 type transport system permease protein